MCVCENKLRSGISESEKESEQEWQGEKKRINYLHTNSIQNEKNKKKQQHVFYHGVSE